jgi:hypothetical protein
MFTRAVTQKPEKLSAEALENIAVGIFPLVEKLFAELQRLDATRAELDTVCAAMPDTTCRQLDGINFAARVVQRYPTQYKRAPLLEQGLGACLNP